MGFKLADEGGGRTRRGATLKCGAGIQSSLRDEGLASALTGTAADFKARFKISLADAFAAALAREKKAELVTGDPEFKPFWKEIKINWLK